MAFLETKTEIEYPESDGEPVGETDWHIDWTFRLRAMLKWRYRNQSVYVGSDLIVYYENGNPVRSVVPDGFVVLNHPTHKRRVYKIWEEGREPDVAFEFTSMTSKRKDTIHKPRIYAEIGIKEYFIYDPENEYLQPRLQGFRLVVDRYESIEPDQDGSLNCEVLGLGLRIQNDDLVISDLANGMPLLTQAEAEAEHAKAERERADAEARRAETEGHARQAVERELEQLRQEIRRLRGDS